MVLWIDTVVEKTEVKANKTVTFLSLLINDLYKVVEQVDDIDQEVARA